ncbi:MAG: hypothetical protein U1F76_31475 [Candidatus Competibacteraceae bacterium]
MGFAARRAALPILQLNQFIEGREQGTLATDQLLNAMYLVTKGRLPPGEEREQLLELVFQDLGSG